MKNKQELNYNSKAELISMIVRAWETVPNYVAKQRLMEFLLANYRGVDFSSLKALENMPYDELETMYRGIQFIAASM
jgi:hypothetical protein